MTRDEIIRMAREAQLAYGSDEFLLSSVAHFVALVTAAERNKLASWMMAKGYATGHGDTTEDLLSELGWQISEGLKMERETCADLCKEFDSSHPFIGQAKAVAAAIRARGKA